ncbi:DUF386 domain-containing protein [Puteibacter caeruleilacunae]|nr:DUF386 domain-containing protein [Puteibacter caeruleilacunae]
MAIIGTLKEVKAQCCAQPLIQKGIDYLLETNLKEVFDSIPAGEVKKVELEGDSLFAVFQKYDSKPTDDVWFEAHRKYIDIQYIWDGSEEIWVAPIEEIQDEKPYEEENDFHLMKAKSHSVLTMNPGYASVLFPNDLHAPGLRIDGAQPICKIVVKVMA